MIDKKIVLCVDDDPDDREIVGMAISEIDPNLEVVHAENGMEAYSYLTEVKSTGKVPCLIILDVNMPVMDGRETLVELKKDETLSKIPVAMFTTSASASDKNFFLKYDVDMITKPNDLSSITTEVKKMLGNCV